MPPLSTCDPSEKIIPISSGSRRAQLLRRRDRLILEHLDLVPPIARRIHACLPPSFDVEDLIGVGNLALLHAAIRYRPRKHGNAPFSAFARRRIHGAMIDSVRRRHFIENTRPSIHHLVENADPEVSAAADRVLTDPAPSIEVAIDRGRALNALLGALESLPARQRAVLERQYGDETKPAKRAKTRRARAAHQQKVIEITDRAIGELRTQLAPLGSMARPRSFVA